MGSGRAGTQPIAQVGCGVTGVLSRLHWWEVGPHGNKKAHLAIPVSPVAAACHVKLVSVLNPCSSTKVSYCGKRCSEALLRNQFPFSYANRHTGSVGAGSPASFCGWFPLPTVSCPGRKPRSRQSCLAVAEGPTPAQIHAFPGLPGSCLSLGSPALLVPRAAAEPPWPPRLGLHHMGHGCTPTVPSRALL